jgi:hypothetical protein
VFWASSCPSSGATTTAVAASGLLSELGDSSAVGRGQAGRPYHDQQHCCHLILLKIFDDVTNYEALHVISFNNMYLPHSYIFYFLYSFFRHAQIHVRSPALRPYKTDISFNYILFFFR